MLVVAIGSAAFLVLLVLVQLSDYDSPHRR
jgi:hypothetical protein